MRHVPISDIIAIIGSEVWRALSLSYTTDKVSPWVRSSQANDCVETKRSKNFRGQQVLSECVDRVRHYQELVERIGPPFLRKPVRRSGGSVQDQ